MNEWIALRNLIDSLESGTAYRDIDSVAQRLLEWIWVRLQSKELLFVQEIIVNSGVASPATLHKCIAILAKEGLLKLSVDPEDGRRRRVETSPHCERVLRELSQSVSAWAESLSQDPCTRTKKT